MPDEYDVLGIRVHPVDYSEATRRVMAAAHDRRGFSLSALAVHGVMTGVLDRAHRARLNQLDLVVPDGQPVRWALNLVHRLNCRERVYGPSLMLTVCARAAREELPVFLFGSRQEVLDRLSANLTARFPALRIAGARPSRFRQLTEAENEEMISEIRESGAAIVFVGLGCPRQEVWAFENRDALSLPILAVGAAFDFHAGLLPQAPPSMQRLGLEWMFRLWQEPRRLWRRYLYLNPLYVALTVLQILGLRRSRLSDTTPSPGTLRYG